MWQQRLCLAYKIVCAHPSSDTNVGLLGRRASEGLAEKSRFLLVYWLGREKDPHTKACS